MSASTSWPIPRVERVGQGLDEVLLQADAVLDRAEVGRSIRDVAEGLVDAADVGLELGQIGSVVGQRGRCRAFATLKVSQAAPVVASKAS